MTVLALSPSADTRTITERVNVVGRYQNMATAGVPFADLPADVAAFARAFVTDASATTFHSVVAGGGANRVPVWFDQVSGVWRIG